MPEWQYYLSVGGEIREELDQAHNEDWGARDLGRNIFILQRYHVHADLHLGARIRVFGQLRSGLENGRKNGPRTIDEDRLNVQNLFLDMIPYMRSERKFILRLGRQEIQYGSGRLIDVRDGPNLRLYFDGAKVAYSSPKLTVDGFLFADGMIKTGVFDNPSRRKASLWGIYSTYAAAKIVNIDLYYLGVDRANARFDEGAADESRQTFGARFWRNGTRLLYNFEVGYQLGQFGKNKIRAWGGSSEIGYLFK